VQQQDADRRAGEATHRITVRGRLSDRFADAFRAMTLVPGCRQTSLIGRIEDQAHLFGLLDRIRELGLELVSVESLDGWQRDH